MLISPNEINKILKVTGNDVTKRGKKYYEMDKAEVVSFKCVSDSEFFVKAFVEGRTEYEVQIIKKNNILKYKCECPSPKGRNTPCKHVIAVLFDMYINPEKYIDFKNNKEKEDSYEIKKYSFDSNDIINKKNTSSEGYIGYYQNLEFEEYDIYKKDDVKLHPKLDFIGLNNKYLKVSFEIGTKKMYVLHDIFEFGDNLIDKNIFSYGKELEFKHEIDSFDTSSKKIVNFLMQYISTYKSFSNITEIIKIPKQLKDSIVLKYGLLDSFFEIYKDNQIYLNDYGYVKFVEQDPIFDFSVLNNESIGCNIYNNSDEYYIYYGTEFAYVLYQNKLYKCTKGFRDKLIPLLETFKQKRNTLIHVLNKDISAFLNYVYPSIKEYSNVEIDDETLKKYSIDDLGIKVYLDVDKQLNIIANLRFCYNKNEFNPFDENAIVNCNRNLIKEKKVKQLFEKYNFLLNTKEKHLVLKDEDSIYEFLTNGIEIFMQKFEVFISDNLKNKKVIKNKNIKLGVRINNNLLELDFEKLGLDEKEVREIFKQYKLKKKYYRLKDGSFINLNYSSIDTLYKMHDEFNVTENELASGIVKLPQYRIMALNRLLKEDNSINYYTDNKYSSIINDVTNMSNMSFNENDIPSNLNANLREYQKRGYYWLKVLDKYNFGGILADDMGLGKTLQVITLLLDEKNNNEKQNIKNIPSIVICPTSLYLNWDSEIKKYAPSLKTLIISGTQSEREKFIKSIHDYDVVITSYDMLKRDIEKYRDVKFRYSIADEAQYIKNNNTKNAESIKKINAKTKYALTGTPIENSLSELWSIFDYIMPGYLYNYTKFKNIYENPIVKEEDKDVHEKLKISIAPFILRRIKKEVLKELPEKTEIVMYNQMQDEQAELYDAYLADTKLKISEEILNGNFEKNHIKILSLITRLRQICSHPSLFVNGFKEESSKLNQCIELVKDGIYSGHKILVFSSFTSMFDIIREKLDEEGIEYYVLTGKTDVSTRIKMVESFNTSDKVKVFLISLKAGGTGLNLIGADMVIHYDPWWNLAAQNQATDRAYRIGQKNNVQVYKLITKNTIEEKMLELQDKKKDLIEKVISEKETFINKLSKEDIMKIFGM